jgi:starch synthase
VRATGGLADTVQDGVTGFTFADYNPDAFWGALARALGAYRERKAWTAIQREGMKQSFSWERSARGYVQLYEWALARQRGG